jgi:hypothetical protein
MFYIKLVALDEPCCPFMYPYIKLNRPWTVDYVEKRLHLYNVVLLNRSILLEIISLLLVSYSRGSGSVVGWGTMLQAGRTRVRFPTRLLDFSVGLILPAALWSWGRLRL